LRDKALRTLSSLPPFSPVLNRLLASLAEEDVSFVNLAELVEKDTVIAANLLHLVNSAMYARRGTVSSVRHALSVLGVNKLRNAILGMSVTRLWRKVRLPSSWSMARFNLHSAAVAILGDLIVQNIPADYPEGAFVAGLLHDTGRLLIAMGLPLEHDQIEAIQDRELISRLECEQRVLGFCHPELSARALEIWNLPAEIQSAVADHHSVLAWPGVDSPDLLALRRAIKDGGGGNSGLVPLACVVAAANVFVNSTGISISPEPASPCGNPAALGALGLDAKQQSVILGEFKTEFDAMSPFFR